MGYLCANYGLPSLSVLHLGPMYATDVRRQTDRQTSEKKHRLMPPPIMGGSIISRKMFVTTKRQQETTNQTASTDCYRSSCYCNFKYRF